MAGESPDKSEQQQSSGETTTSERDPRLAVSHSPSPSGKGEDGARTANGSGTSAAGSGSAAAGSVDQATAVFRAPRQEDGDSRLRAAVAAWVDQEAEAESDTAGSEGAERGAAGSGAAEPGVVKSADSVSGDRESDGAEARDADTADTADTKDSRTAPSTGAKPTAGDAKPETNGSEPASTGTKSEAVDNAATTGATADADATVDVDDKASDDKATADKAQPSRTEPEPGAASGTKAESESEPVAESASKSEPATKPGTEPDSDDDASAARTTSWGAKRSTTPEPRSTSSEPKPTPSEPKATPSEPKATPSEPKATPSEPKATPSEPEADLSESKAGSSEPKAGSSEPKAQAAEAKAQAPEVKAAEAKGQGSDRKSDGKGAQDEGIDQPTTVFKAVAPPAVDQPTAMLKLPSPQRESAAGRTGEEAGERTSRFVPLRPDDAGTANGAPAKKLDAPARKPEAPKVTPPPATGPGFGAPSGAVPERAERTRQQPLPPKPPLDLLAELTNTPPPPQTPVRTTVRRFKIWTPLVLLLLVVFAVVQILRPLPAPKLTLTSSATYTFNGGELSLPWPAEGQSAVAVDGVGSLGTHGEQKPAPLASVAKTMTAYVILKGHPITGKQEGEKITVDQQAEDDAKKPDESTAPIRKDQQFTEKQMLELLMIPSGNNAARLLARWDAGSEDAFIAKMNDAAKGLGMTSTTYTDPSGLKETTVSTPTDQLKLAQAVMQNDIFREIVNTPQIKIPGIDTMIYNNNTILLKPGVSGIKTGSSTPAGGNLLWAADTVVDGKNQRIYGIVMGQRTGTTLDNKLKSAISNSYTLIQAVQKAVTSATVVKKGEVVGYVDDGLGGRTPVVAAKDLKAVGWPGLKVDVTLGDAGKAVPHSAKPGTVVGELSIGTGNGRLTAPVELGRALTEPGVGDKLTRLG
ncbi:D-alanyl-D-alanine carboxypeptidase [Streptomyces sp. SDr-06]|uniref:D-alanyl-D-alanine carboxypeptidase n=1 Tax=Streptomyces sp. SDr-06 TaxID=2267702 RepID=UPI001675A40E|nr:serine hydrolase [Streptomyces sp. SDr-06]